MIKYFLFFFALNFSFVYLQAQVIDPEVKGLYDQATDAINQKDYDRAISIYFQAIRMQPNNVILRRDLAYTYYLAGKPDEGLEIINEVIRSGSADEQTFQIASALEQAKGNEKKAARLIDQGLNKFPNSGILHNTKGTILAANPKNIDNAVKYFIKGIKAAPDYAMNYYNASRYLLEIEQPFWSIIYGEIFVLLDPQNPRTIEVKKNLITAYKNLFSVQGSDGLPSFRKSNKSSSTSTFEGKALPVYFDNFAAVSDGYDTENLIMLRTRFLIDWHTKYPLSSHSLFSYYDELLKQGYFDIYNQNLFGAVTNSQGYATWLKRNSETVSRYGEWMAINPYRPTPQDPQFQ